MNNNFRIIALTGLLLITMSAQARFNGANRNAPKAIFGLRAGVAASVLDIKGPDYAEALATPVLGFSLDVKLASLPIYLETGAYYMDMGSRFDDDCYWYHPDRYYDHDKWQTHGRYEGRHDHSYDSHHHDGWDDDSYSVHNHSILVPLAISYHLYASDKIVIQPFTGVYTSYGFNMKQFDFGLRDGIGFSFGQFHMNMGIQIGLIEQQRHDEDLWIDDAQHLSLFFGIGVNF